MNKMLLMLPCITAYSFVCSMEPERLQSPRQSSPRSIPITRSDSSPFRDRKSSHPIERVKKESLGTHDSMSEKDRFYAAKELEKYKTNSKAFNRGNFAAEENITPRTLQRTNSAEPK